MPREISKIIRQRLRARRVPFAANDNISDHISEPEKVELRVEVAAKAQALLDALIIDTDKDPNTNGTAGRMAKMFVCEVASGRFDDPPRITTFPNTKKLDELVVTGPISIRSLCSHHFCPINGRCWIGYVPGNRLPGLSKFNRIVDWFASRPQIQEELVMQIADYLENLMEPKGVAVSIRAAHTCMTWRGVRETEDAVMTTNVMRGCFRTQPEARAEFLAACGIGR